MAHPSRLHFVKELVPRLGPGCRIVFDRKNERWDTGARALLAHDPQADYHCVVQDDAVLCRDFTANLPRIAAGLGSSVGCLYIGRVRPHQRTVSPALRYVSAMGGTWLDMDGPWWGVAIIVPTAYIEPLVAWGNIHTHIANYDKRIARYCKLNRIRCLYSVPSLVDHRRVAENPSLVAGRNGDRRAQWFIGANRSPAEYDWTQPPQPLKVRFRHTRTGRELLVFVGGPKWEQMRRLDKWEEVAA